MSTSRTMSATLGAFASSHTRLSKMALMILTGALPHLRTERPTGICRVWSKRWIIDRFVPGVPYRKRRHGAALVRIGARAQTGWVLESSLTFREKMGRTKPIVGLRIHEKNTSTWMARLSGSSTTDPPPVAPWENRSGSRSLCTSRLAYKLSLVHHHIPSLLRHLPPRSEAA